MMENKLSRQLKKINNKLYSHFYINTNYKIENTIFLAGTGRSGTTWLPNIINYKNDYRYMFEPFMPDYTRECREFHNKQYLREDNDNDYFFEAAQRILSGNVRSEWIDRYNTKFICNKRLIKDIRANLFLKWMKKNFSSIHIVLTMRHPYAVTVSKINRKWNISFDTFYKQTDLVNDFLSDHISEMKKCKDAFEKSIYIWCIENFIPLKQFKKGEIYIIFYEKICENPLKEIKDLFKWLKIDYTDEVNDFVNKPSVTAQETSLIKTGKNPVTGWTESVDKNMMNRALNILKSFELDRIYNNSPFPLCDDIWELSNS